MIAGTKVNKELSITVRNHFVALQSLLFLVIISIAILYFFNFDVGMTIAFTIGVGIDAITSLYLHFEYLLRNKGEEYKIRDTELIRRKGGEETILRMMK